MKDCFDNIKLRLEDKFADKEDLIEDAIDDAMTIYCNLRNAPEQTEFESHEINWIKRCASELLSSADYEGFIKYSENGFNVERFENGLSPSLVREIVPKVKKL